ncbi:histidine kinase [Streptomyces sp. JH34]|uniref:sensor histidine kinase n=1 Tax=Streptomyces sp. JH34 TaxID=2793633 RepID=UPI0023F8BA8B|nr:histidine kinase [Streptomyces sp. JH34]MDF6019430.1 histidine kinase [Streptomyces sp. JH34]
MQGDPAGAATRHLPGRPGQEGSGADEDMDGRTPSWALRVTGVLLGCATASAGVLAVLLAGVVLGPFLLWPRARPGAFGLLMVGARRLAGIDRMRRSLFFGDRFPEHYESCDRKILHYLAVRGGTGLLCGAVIGLLGFGAVLAGLLLRGAVQGSLRWDELLTQALLGGVLLFLGLQGLRSLVALDSRLARGCFGPSEQELLHRRIDELAVSRAAVVRAVDAERRRIERDIHDGIQQRLVALAMLLGRARRGRDPEQADALLHQAHQESREVLAELREVAWRVYPSALDDLGLEEALGGVAERCGIPVRTEFAVHGPLPRPVETAAYFVVSETVTNAAKHSGATAVSVHVLLDGRVLTVRVRDNGKGGADPAGVGLSGLRSRVDTLDGALHIDSPEGGPTMVTAELPCV